MRPGAEPKLSTGVLRRVWRAALGGAMRCSHGPCAEVRYGPEGWEPGAKTRGPLVRRRHLALICGKLIKFLGTPSSSALGSALLSEC